MFDVVKFLAESGNDEAKKTIVGDILSNGKNSVTAGEADTCLKYLNTLAEKDDPEALLSLGALYYTGLGDFVPQDYKKAMTFYQKAAEASELKDGWALNNLGYCYYYGRDGVVDYQKAFSCFAQAATFGNPNAMYKLGDMYYAGNYVKQDLDAAFYWYALAKEQEADSDIDYAGFLAASIAMRLGRAFLFGEGTDIDLINALFELRTAETLFYHQILIGDKFSKEQLLKTQELIETTKAALEDEINLE
ncbi:MAG: sel1 repeat family protein [Actinomycetia bacterium]|nr:sel1 repeat family protein [Actinomycetes bacterium]